MTWKDVIDRVGQEVRDELSWPGNGEATRKQHMSSTAGLAEMDTAPLESLEWNTKALTSNHSEGSMDAYSMPDDMNDVREDLGMSHTNVDGTDCYPYQAVPYGSVAAASDNDVQTDNILFSILRDSM